MIASNSIPPQRMQQTIAGPAEISGVGFFTGADVTLRFLPAAAGHGIAFQRTDRPGTAPIPAIIAYAVPRRRRTAIEHQGVAVEMTEHVLAALAGLRIDNCLVELNAPEPPGCDGSSRAFAEALLEAGIVVQDEPRTVHVIESPFRVGEDVDRAEIAARPLSRGTLAISYHLDYGPRSPIPPQTLTVEISPETFVNELAFARTFVLESEVEALRAQGHGTRISARDLLVFGPDGVIDNQLRADDECVRHKILDCLGDFALLGCDIHGHVSAYRSGHQLNRELIHRLQMIARRLPAAAPRRHAA
ncbi:MAG: UDP-3-O-acyl-N-acetylglucosamine deacetylase [Planctomycetaceae bacterium]